MHCPADHLKTMLWKKLSSRQKLYQHLSPHALHLMTQRQREKCRIYAVFKDNRSKFRGDLDDNIMDYIRQYDVTCRNLSLIDQIKYELMHNLFRDDAKEWFFANIFECVPKFSGGYNGAIIKLREE
jgi:hypothetical protein